MPDILPRSVPIQQRLGHFDDDRRRAIGVEIAKILAACFIKEVYHSNWLSNAVLVKKKIGQWRMCVDYTSLNKSCPKDHFALPRIDQVVDSTSGCEILSFLGRLLWLSSNCDEGIRPAHDIFHHSVRFVLLCNDAVRLKECGCDLSVLHTVMFC